MVREVVGYAMACALALALCCPLPAMADEEDAVESGSTGVMDYSDFLEDLDSHLVEGNQDRNWGYEQIVTHLLTIESYLEPKPEPVEIVDEVSIEEGPTEIELLEHIDETLTELVEEPEPVQKEGVEPLRATRLSLSAYTNVSSTNQYAEYAKGLLPRVGFDKHYCFLQDEQQAYTFVWGNLSKVDATTISGTDCCYMRWYWASQSQGWLVQSGTADVAISTGSRVVLSDLEGFSMLDAQQDSLRKEVGFYAVVAAALFSLRFVWSFLVRMRGSVVSE